MASETAKTEDFTHVRVRAKKRDRAKEVSRKLAAIESRDVPYCDVLDEILEEGLTKREKKLGITVPK